MCVHVCDGVGVGGGGGGGGGGVAASFPDGPGIEARWEAYCNTVSVCVMHGGPGYSVQQ